MTIPPFRRSGPTPLVDAVVVENGDGWAIDTSAAATPDAYIVSDGGTGYEIDTTAVAGLAVQARASRPFVEEA